MVSMKKRLKKRQSDESQLHIAHDVQSDAQCKKHLTASSQYNGDFITDPSWLPQSWTLEKASHTMQQSICEIEKIPDMEYLWANELKDQHEQTLPNNRSLKRERTSNSFLQYRILVQRAFTGKQTLISSYIEALWRTESKEMQFYCYRNSEIENCTFAMNDN